MQIKILSPYWGHTHLTHQQFLKKIIDAGYDGIDTWIPADSKSRNALYDDLQKHQLLIVTHQHEANGTTFKQFRASFKENLYRCAEPNPVLINSHTGRDYFSFEDNLALIDIAAEFTAKTGIRVAHETHRGRIGYGPAAIKDYFLARENFNITADLSHWVCVSESMLENFTDVVTEAIQRTKHVHARIGFEQGPQVPDPRAPEWSYALTYFFSWWDRIVESNQNNGAHVLTFTTEFGPPPYMPVVPFTQQPVADRFEINCYMKDLLRARYGVLM
ncbi:sugar phosphate isomerase/epimerase family protein [Mucilaginibacter sp. AW1-3]